MPKETPAPPTESERFIDGQEKIIDAHARVLRFMGRLDEADPMDARDVLGTYEWHRGKNGGYFGAYSFSKAAWDQANRSWWVHGQMEAGSDLLVAVGRTKFDKSVIGHKVGSQNYCALTGGKLRHCDESLESATVVEFVNETTIRLDKKAKWDTNTEHLAIVPPYYQDLCNCVSPMGAGRP